MSNFDLVFYIVCLCLFISWIVDKIKSKKLTKKLDDVAPKVGMPNKDKVDVLLALFAIRCYEISYFYLEIDTRHKDVGDANWLELFIEESLLVPTMNESYGEVSEKKRLKIKNEAKKISTKLFDYDHYTGSLSNKDVIKLAFICYHDEYYSSSRLRGIKNYGFFEDTIQALIEEYDSFNGVSSDSFIRPKFYNLSERSRAFQADENINKIWKLILLSLKASLRMLQSRKEDTFDVEKILKEIDALERLERELKYILSKRNYKKRFCDTQKEEAIIRSVWEKSPFINIY